ncbi:MAG: hypothetical protein HYV63_00970 [Candidatus Schekmanbacteria bacterium]|nr:hypothetical protein [Candidatus Schekmanbacteria bacterium]
MRTAKNVAFSGFLLFSFMILLAFYSPAGARRTDSDPTTLRFVLIDSNATFESLMQRLKPLDQDIEAVTLDPSSRELTIRYVPERIPQKRIEDALAGIMSPGQSL